MGRGPVTEQDHGASDEGSLGVAVVNFPRTRYTFSSKLRVRLLGCRRHSSGTPAETVAPAGWMSPCLQGWRRSWSNQHAAALHHGQQGPKESPFDEQVVTHGLAVISFKSLGTDPRLLCRVPSRQSLGHWPHSSVYSTALSSCHKHLTLLGFLVPRWGSQQSVANKATHSL